MSAIIYPWWTAISIHLIIFTFGYFRAKVLLRRRNAIIAVISLILIMMIYSAWNTFPSLDLVYDPFTEIHYCLPVKNVNYMFNISPWIDQALYQIVPGTIIFTLNILIIWKLKSAQSARREITSAPGDNEKDRTRQVTLMLLMVSSFFLLTTLPLCIYQLGKRATSRGRAGEIKIKKKNATWRWQWALPVTAILPYLIV